MKLASKILLSLLVLFSVLPLSVMADAPDETESGDYGRNLIRNGTFDAVAEPPSVVDSWETWPESDEFATVNLESQPSSPVLKIHTNNIPVQWGIVEAHQWVAIEDNQLFDLKADVYYESAVDSLVSMRIDFYDETLNSSEPNLPAAYLGHYISNLYAPNGKFEPIAIEGITPEGARYAKVEFDIKAYEAGAQGTVYVDNVDLAYQFAPKNLRKTAQTESSISFAWDKPLYGEGYVYELYRVIGEVGGDDDESIGVTETDQTSFTWDGLYSPTNLKEAVMAYSFYVVAKPEGEPSRVSKPSNTLRIATLKPDGKLAVMTIGDSLTLGYPIPPGYRGPLWELLQKDHDNTLFVGSMNDGATDNVDFDADHEGHPGWTTEQIAELVDSQIKVYDPDYVLLMAGSNYMMHYNNQAAHMKAMIEEIASNLPNTYVIVAAIPDLYLFDDTLIPLVRQYNEELKEVVRQLREEGKKVGIVDMNSMVTRQYYLDPDNDDIHPNKDGYQVMADVWFDALDAAIAAGDVSAGLPTKPVLDIPVLIGNTDVQLSWQEAEDNVGVDRYKIYVNNEEKTSVTGSTYGVVTNLKPSNVYSFSVGAVDKAGNETVSEPVSFAIPDVPDTTPPSSPSELMSTDVSYNSAKLSWVPGSDDVGIGEYKIRYGGSSVSVTDVTYGADNMTHEVTGLLPETRYDFDVIAIDLAGNESEASDPISVETLAAPPSNLRLAAKTTTSVTLAWDAATDKDGISGYRIYQNGSYVTETKETTYKLSGLNMGQTYTFQVTAVDTNSIETLKSVELTEQLELPAPKNIVMKANSERTIDIQWSSVDGAIGYEVYMNGTKVATTENTSYHADKLNPETAYTFAVKSLFGEGLKSELSATVEFTTEKVPETPPGGNGGTGGSGGLGGFGGIILPANTEPKYETTDKGIKMTYAPSKDELLKSLNSSDARLTVNVPTGKRFDLLQLELDGEVLKLAAEKKKPVVIRMGSLALELSPGWLNVADKDKVTFTIVKKSLEGNKASISQSLQPLSDSYDLTVERNGTKATEFTKPVRLTISTKTKPDPGVTGIYLWDNAKGTWTSLGGTVDESGNVSLDLSHFSEYAVFTAAKVKTFVDITNHWARKEIESLAAREIVKGATAERFNPSGEVTRAEFAAMLARAFNLKPPAERSPFDDVKEGSWYYDSIAAAYQAGWIQGVGGGKFAPSNRITREEMAVMIWKAYAYAKGGNAGQEAPTGELKFADAAKISKWAVEAVEQATAQGLIQGMSGSFKPDLYADRAQAAVMISRLLDKTDRR